MMRWLDAEKLPALVARHSSKHRLTSSTVHPGDDSSKKRRLSASFMEKIGALRIGSREKTTL